MKVILSVRRNLKEHNKGVNVIKILIYFIFLQKCQTWNSFHLNENIRKEISEEDLYF